MGTWRNETIAPREGPATGESLGAQGLLIAGRWGGKGGGVTGGWAGGADVAPGELEAVLGALDK